MSHRLLRIARSCSLVVLLLGMPAPRAGAQAVADKAASADFPRALVEVEPSPKNPVFTAAGPGHWDAALRERGWILREGDAWHLWYTGYDGTRAGIKQLGYATSPDGIAWTRHPGNPLVAGHYLEDMMVVKRGDTYYMFAEGQGDRAQLLTSQDRIHWERAGTLDIRYVDGRPLTPGPFGTPTAWFENDTWHLFYERGDRGIWLAKSSDLKVWTNVQDEPVIVPGPDNYDSQMIALNQIIKYDGRYYAWLHGTGDPPPKRIWNTNLAMSTDLVHWRKYPGNPVIANQSSALSIGEGRRLRLYTMHEAVNVYFPRSP
jgi:predicted GH43/DUF377 family glycosyl hydrolase